MNSVNLQNIKSIYKNLLCDLYFNNKLLEREIKEKIPTITALCIKKKYLATHLTKEVEELKTIRNSFIRKKLKTKINGKKFYVHG